MNIYIIQQCMVFRTSSASLLGGTLACPSSLTDTQHPSFQSVLSTAVVENPQLALPALNVCCRMQV